MGLFDSWRDKQRFQELQQKNIFWKNREHNEKLMHFLTGDYALSAILRAFEDAQHDLQIQNTSFTPEPAVQAEIEHKIQAAYAAQEQEQKLIDVICACYAAEESPDRTPPGAPDSFDERLRYAAANGLDEKARFLLGGMRQLSKKTLEDAKRLLLQEAQKMGRSPEPGEEICAASPMRLPDTFGERELHNLMQFIAFQVEGHTLLEPLGEGLLLTWRNKKLLDLYLKMLQKDCAPDGITVSYEAQVQPGWNGTPQTVQLPHCYEKRMRMLPDVNAKVILRFSCRLNG